MMAASCLILAALCANFVQVTGQCENCGFLGLGCCVDDDYQFPTTTVTSSVTTTTTQHQTHTVTATEHLTETEIQTTTTTQHVTVTSTELATTTLTEFQPPSTVTASATETVTATTTEFQPPSTVTASATETVTATTTEFQPPSTVTASTTETVTATTTEFQPPSTVTASTTETVTATTTEFQPPSTVTASTTETVTTTTTEQVTSTQTQVETVSEVETKNITQTVTDTLKLNLTSTKTVTSIKQNVQTTTLKCSTSSWLAAVSDCPTWTTTDVITVSQSPFCSGEPQALDTVAAAQTNLGNGGIAAVMLAIILVLAAVVCSVSWVVCFRTSRKKRNHMLDPVHLMRVGTGTDTRSSDGGRPLSMCNPVYANIDTLPSITAGMTETLDGDPPDYCTVKTLSQSGCSSVKYMNVSRHKQLGMTESDDLTKPQMNDHYDRPSANTATMESVYSTDKNMYWSPAATLEELRKQQKEKSLKSYHPIEPQHVSLSSPLGKGEFGAVYKGVWMSRDGSIEVAVKTLHDKEGKSTVGRDGQVELLKEAAVMGQFNHANVVALYGVVDTTDTVMLVMEYMAGGNLKSYLDSAAKNPLLLDPPRLLRWCQEIAGAMNYLSSKGFIHRDLAARNILRNGQDQCKIADFGMSRDLEEDYYYKPKGGRIPIRWTAPEAIFYRKYTTKSDVWSYGMVMYEIWSLGHKPFENWEIADIVTAFSNGYCQVPPPGCPRGVYHLMVQCWNPDHHQRVSFSALAAQLSENPTSLLAWTEGDQDTAPQANVLGAPLEEGAALYQDLQMLYSSVQEVH